MNTNESEPDVPPRQLVWPEGEVSEHAGLLRHCASIPAERGLVIVFVPSLAATLLNADRAKAQLLTTEEAADIRDRCPCIILPPDTAKVMEEQRGYADFVPDTCWEEFQRLKAQLDLPASA